MALLTQSDRTVRRPDRRQSSPSPTDEIPAGPLRGAGSTKVTSHKSQRQRRGVADVRTRTTKRVTPSDTRVTRTKLLFNRVNDKSGRASDRAGSAGMQLVCINAPAPTHPPSRRVPSERRRSWQNRFPQPVTSPPAPANCTRCGYKLNVDSTRHLPPFPPCNNGLWSTLPIR